MAEEEDDDDDEEEEGEDDEAGRTERRVSICETMKGMKEGVKKTG